MLTSLNVQTSFSDLRKPDTTNIILHQREAVFLFSLDVIWPVRPEQSPQPHVILSASALSTGQNCEHQGPSRCTLFKRA